MHGGELEIQGTRSSRVIKIVDCLRPVVQEQKNTFKIYKRRCYFESIIDSSKFKTISGPLHLILTPINYTSSQASDYLIKQRLFIVENLCSQDQCMEIDIT